MKIKKASIPTSSRPSIHPRSSSSRDRSKSFSTCSSAKYSNTSSARFDGRPSATRCSSMLSNNTTSFLAILRPYQAETVLIIAVNIRIRQGPGAHQVPLTSPVQALQDFLSSRNAIQSFERIGVFANQQNERGCLRIGLGATLLPLFQRPFIDPQLPSEDGTRAMQSPASVSNQLGVHLRKRRSLHLVVAQCQFALAVALHRRYAFHQLPKNLSLCHRRVLPGFPSLTRRFASRASTSASIAFFSAFISFGVRSAASFLS